MRTSMLWECEKHEWTKWEHVVPLTSSFEEASFRRCPACGAQEADDGYRITHIFGSEQAYLPREVKP